MANRKLPLSGNQWRNTLESALEHASHAWVALERLTPTGKKGDSWPPEVDGPTGSAAYHLAAMIGYVFEVYQGIAKIYSGETAE